MRASEPVAGGSNAIAGYLRSFLPSSAPLMARANYGREILAAVCLSFMLAGVETNVVSVLVRNAFDGVVADTTLNFVVAVLAASKAAANVSSFAWVRLNHGLDKLRFTIWLQWAMAAVVVVLAFTPLTAVGLWLFACGVLLTRAIWSGFITIRSTIWNANYDRSYRAVLTGKFAAVQVTVVGLLSLGLGQAMDLNENAFRVLFVIGAVVGSAGILSWSRVRVRGHRKLMRDEASDDSSARPSFNPVRAFAILRHDRSFSGYMACMFLLGLGNLMVPPLLAIVVKERFGMGYLGGMVVTTAIPMLMMPLLIPMWARMLSHMHVVRFRVIHAWVFATANGLFFVAALLTASWLLYVAAVVQGLAFAGGALAWTLGHLDFAPPQRASQYMSVHVTLTGVRGLISPFLGVWLYHLMEQVRPGSGSVVFGLSATLSVLGALGFLSLSSRMGLGATERAGPVEALPPSRAGV